MKDKDFINFGYESNQVCCVCGKTPARIEPRFNYSVCINHYKLSPIKISELKENIYKK